MIKKMFNIIRKTFDLKANIPEDMSESIMSLEFDGVSKGKGNMRSDIYRFGNDFKKSITEYKENQRLLYE